MRRIAAAVAEAAANQSLRLYQEGGRPEPATFFLVGDDLLKCASPGQGDSKRRAISSLAGG